MDGQIQNQTKIKFLLIQDSDSEVSIGFELKADSIKMLLSIEIGLFLIKIDLFLFKIDLFFLLKLICFWSKLFINTTFSVKMSKIVD